MDNQGIERLRVLTNVLLIGIVVAELGIESVSELGLQAHIVKYIMSE